MFFVLGQGSSPFALPTGSAHRVVLTPTDGFSQGSLSFRFVMEGEEMRNVYTFAGLTLALALAFSVTAAAQTSSTESKQQASPDQSQTDSAGNRHRDRVAERLEWLSQHLNLTEGSEESLEANSRWRVQTNESGGRRRITDSRSKARKDEANPRSFATAGSGHPYARTTADIRSDEGRSQRATRREVRTKDRATARCLGRFTKSAARGEW